MGGVPVDRLVAKDGSIRAMVFENEFAGVERNMFWSVEINFEPVLYDGEEVQPSMSAHWIVLPVRDWRKLQGVTINGDRDTIEASFYVFEHDLASWSEIAFGERRGRQFDVTFDMKVDILGLDEPSEGADVSVQEAFVKAQTTLPYQGFSIHSSLVEGIPENKAKALEIASHYADLDRYNVPALRYGTWGFDPNDST